MSFIPTQEQIDILDTFTNTRVMKVNAVAGSGKSSTLKLLAETNPQSSLYLCFNKSIADEANTKFPVHVDCRTSHSMAFSAIDFSITRKVNRPQGRYRNCADTPSEIAIYYKIKPFPAGYDDLITPNAIASLVKRTVKRFENSADTDLSQKHVPYQEIVALEKTHPEIDKKAFVSLIHKTATKMWADKINPHTDVLVGFNGVLKLWQLSKPKLNYDIIYVDEAQDTNPCVLDIIQRQSCKIIYVGDQYQSIYQFRGAVNAMEIISAPSKTLTKSFRYGEKIAAAAKWIINGAIDVKGSEHIDSKVCEVDQSKPFTKIYRLNSTLFYDAVDYVQQGKSVYCEVDIKKFISMLWSAYYLYKGDMKKVKQEDIAIHSDWRELLEAAKEDGELKRIAKVVMDGEVKEFADSLGNLSTKPDDADIILTTAHKSKGREWSQVILADDFATPESTTWEDIYKQTPQEVNLFYVATTRAIDVLQMPSKIIDMNIYWGE